MKTKILIWSMVFVLTAASAAESTEPAQVISLSDGSKVTFLGITYGKHHVAPNYEAIGGNIRTGHWINRSNDVAVAWIEIDHDPAQFPNYLLFVSDKADANGIGFRADFKSINQVRKGVDVEGFELGAYPRWDKQFYLHIYSSQSFFGQRLSNEKFLATNPDLKDIGNAIAETLPVAKTNGDLTVTLTNLVSGAPRPPYLRSERILPVDPVRKPEPAPDDPINQSVRFGFDLKQSGHATPDWQLASVVISDAVSNYVEPFLYFQDNKAAGRRYPFIKTPADDYKGYVFWPSLWPNEPAWDVRMEFVPTTDDEIVTFTNLSLRQGTEQDLNDELSWNASKTNFSVIAGGTAQGVRLQMLPPLVRSEPQSGREHLSVILYADPDPGTTMRLTLMEATDGEGENLPIPQFQTPFLPDSNGRYFFTFSDAHNVNTLNLKLALHRSRYVTFTVKPDGQ